MAKTKKNYTYAVGRRKSSLARVRLFKGSEENMVNGILVGKYFPGEKAKVAWSMPFELTEIVGKYYFSARVVGGGKEGQLDAVVMGVSRAIAKVKETHRKPLKKAKLLTRDSRITFKP